MDVLDLVEAVKDKNGLMIAVAALGFVPIVGTVVKKGSKLLKHMDEFAPAVAKVTKVLGRHIRIVIYILIVSKEW